MERQSLGDYSADGEILHVSYVVAFRVFQGRFTGPVFIELLKRLL